MENVNQFFANIGTEQSILILSWLIIAFLLGLLAGYFLRNRYVNELNRLLEEKNKELNAKQAEIDQIQQELALREADLKRAAFEAEEAQVKIRRSNEDIAGLNQRLNSAQAELDKVNAAEQAASQLVHDLNDQILGLKTRLADSGGTLEVSEGSVSNLALERLAAIELQLVQLREENQRLLSELSTTSDKKGTLEPKNIGMVTPQNLPDVTAGETGGEFFVPKVSSNEPVAETPILGSDSSSVFTTDKALLRNVEKNDLTAIDGIGPFLEKKLNDAGVFTYADIASWDSAKIAEITQTIRFFEGRIEKDDWVGQAKKLLKTGINESTVTDSVLAESRSLIAPEEDNHPIPVATDNLKLIHGIDEAIETILIASGIDSFAELSKMEPNELRNMLVVVDPKLGEVDPSAWPAQARLAQNCEWEVLQDYQEQLRGA